LVELIEVLKTEQALRLHYQQELQKINQLPTSPGEQKMQLIDRLNYFLECSSNWVLFGKFKPTSPWKF
jgi:hypothetical protein